MRGCVEDVGDAGDAGDAGGAEGAGSADTYTSIEGGMHTTAVPCRCGMHTDADEGFLVARQRAAKLPAAAFPVAGCMIAKKIEFLCELELDLYYQK